jgi:CheY-like chemotaxis protein
MPTRCNVLVIDFTSTLAEAIQQAAPTAFPEARFSSVSTLKSMDAYLTGSVLDNLSLVLLHVNEPSYDLAIVSRIRSFTRGIPILIISISEESNLVKEAYTQGVNAYTCQPTTPDQWQAYLERLRNFWFLTARVPHIPLGWLSREED